MESSFSYILIRCEGILERGEVNPYEILLSLLLDEKKLNIYPLL